MMRRIDLLPAVYAQRRRDRRNVFLALIAGLLIFALLVVWYFLLGFQINDAEDDLAAIQDDNAALQAEIGDLQQFAQLQAEVEAKRSALQLVMAGDVDWPGLLTEIAMVIPGEVWLTNLTASAGTTEGAAPVPTEGAEIALSNEAVFGRIQFQGSSLNMPGVAKWLIRLEGVDQFFAVYLDQATAGEDEAAGDVVTFGNTLQLSDEASSGRFQGQAP